MNYSVHKDGLNTIKNSETLGIISSDIDRGNNISSYLSNFINDTITLQGENWDKERIKIGEYQKAFNKRSEVAAKMIDAINRAVQLLLDYLADDVYLDPNELDELRATVKTCEEQINSLEAAIVATKEVTSTDANGNVYTTTVSLYSEAEKAQFRQQIEQLREVIKECKRLIAKIEGLPAIYAQALAILAEIQPLLNEFNSLVSSIIPSESVVYTPT